MRMLRMTILGLTVCDGYALWNHYGPRVTALAHSEGSGADPRIYSRSELTVTEWAVGSDDPIAQATAILADSDARTELPRETPGVERRTSEDTVEP